MVLPEKNNSVRPGRAWFRWVTTIILVVWAFILGILVGQGTLANDQQLASLRRLSLSWFGLSSGQGRQQEQQPLRDPELSFYDELGRAHDPPSRPENDPVPPLRDSAPLPPEQHPSVSSPPASLPAARAEAPLAPPETGPAALPPRLDQVRPYNPDAPQPSSGGGSQTGSFSPPPAASSGESQTPDGRFTIQVGSFKEETQAKQLALNLSRNGFPAYISRSQVNNVGLRFRVRVGGYDNLDQAQDVATSLRVRENVTAYVTRNE
ncbi:MAG: SPOR domain-containing protein [Desulfarculales bacterium]|jgi:cell division septation protein DedD|nr:SPOR domain-containing protein [Desulfarculales bacterium]